MTIKIGSASERGWVHMGGRRYEHPEGGTITAVGRYRCVWHGPDGQVAEYSGIQKAQAKIARDYGYGVLEHELHRGGWYSTSRAWRSGTSEHRHPVHGSVYLIPGGIWRWEAPDGTVHGHFLSLQEAKMVACGAHR